MDCENIRIENSINDCNKSTRYILVFTQNHKDRFRTHYSHN
jgi:hypothetical protein